MSTHPDEFPLIPKGGSVRMGEIRGSSELSVITAGSSQTCHDSDSALESSDYETSTSSGKLKKELGLMSAISLIAGTIIGSGIFLTPNDIRERVGSDGMALIVWLLSGIVALLGSLCYAELGTALPSSGGEYVYFRHSYGGLPAFLYTWSSTMIVRPVSTGVTLLTFANYVSAAAYGADCRPPTYTLKIIAAACLVFITCVGCVSAKWSANLSSVSLVIKTTAIGFLIVVGVVSLSQGNYRGLAHGFQNTTIEAGALAFAFYDSLWAYDGWNNANYVVGEMTNPRILPVALFIAIPLVIVLYLLVNIAYMSILPTATFLASKAIALDATEHAIGEAGLVIMPLLVAISCFGSSNGTLFSGARLAVASAKRGDLPDFLRLVHDVYCTPVTAYIFQCVLGLVYIVAIDIHSLILFFSFVAWMFYGLAMVAVILLRSREPDLPRAFKVPLAVPFIMLIFALFLIVTPIYNHPIKSGITLAFLVLSVPIYYVFVANRLLSPHTSQVHRASGWITYTIQRFISAS